MATTSVLQRLTVPVNSAAYWVNLLRPRDIEPELDLTDRRRSPGARRSTPATPDRPTEAFGAARRRCRSFVTHPQSNS